MPAEKLSLETIENAPFGTLFTEKMAISYFGDGVWSEAKLVPVKPLSLHPAAHVLHYSSSCFEGLKAYRWQDDSIQIFRLDRHVERFQESAALLCLPCPDAVFIRSMITQVVDQCRDSVPQPPGALYIRPTLIGTEANVGAAGSSSAEACLYILLSPVGSYFKGGERALRILIEDREMRSTPGFGQAKTGGNYASALRHVLKAKARYNADQVLFCPQNDVQETGASNFLLIKDDEILTKPLTQAYLHGVTRDSVLKLAGKLGYRVTERDFSVAEILEWIRTGEAALSGTAAVLSGVGSFIHQGREYTVSNGQVGRNTKKLRAALTAIQQGQEPDSFGWLSAV